MEQSGFWEEYKSRLCISLVGAGEMETSQFSAVINLRQAVIREDTACVTEAELLDRYVQNKDEAAFEALLERHGQMVWGVCRRTLDNLQDAEDAFQATFLVFVRKAASVRPQSMLGNWLYGVAYHTALKARTLISKRKLKETQVMMMPDSAGVKKDMWSDLIPVLDRELSRLPDKYRSVIVLCDLEGKTRQEAACQLGLPGGTVASRSARGRAMLAKRLGGYGLALSGGALAALLSENIASAGVPTVLASATIKTASLTAMGQAVTTGLVSANVAALTQGVLKAMLITKLRLATAVLLMLGTIALATAVPAGRCQLAIGQQNCTAPQNDSTILNANQARTPGPIAPGKNSDSGLKARCHAGTVAYARSKVCFADRKLSRGQMRPMALELLEN
jgi:RNA polymerase sigma factor (sigma-70 family)